MTDMVATDEERKAIARLRRLARTWPKTLGIFSDGKLWVIRLDANGGFPLRSGRMDQSAVLASIGDIMTDGGDPW